MENGMPEGHMERYHPNGIQEGDRCKYIREDKKTQNVVVAIKSLESNYGIKVVHATKESDLNHAFGADVLTAAYLKIIGKPVSQSVFESNIGTFEKVIKDISNRFPHIDIGNFLLIPWDVLEMKKEYATSTIDKRKDVVTRYMTLGKISDATKASAEHIVRHEIGHQLSDYAVLASFAGSIPKEGTEQWTKFSKAILGVSNRAASHHEEAIAEIFATYTNPEYVKGTMPLAFENLAKAMLGENTKYEGITMDSGISDKDLLKIPLAYRIMIDPYPIPPKDKIAWFDPSKMDFVEFETHDDMLRYVLSIYQFKSDDIERIIKANESRKWNSWSIGLVVSYWLYLGKSIEEIIEEV